MCTVVDAACSSGGTISAKCSKGANRAGVWTDIQGACKAPAGTCSGAPGSVQTVGGGVFSAAAWAAACGSTTRGSGCSANSACSAGTGVISATCDASGS
ncbi:hypothetical protein OEZ86_008445 [Tetradesmus obliquus]|nr:hypothetical protein OEZ86_008445 [Tetradesmus obliquus]